MGTYGYNFYGSPTKYGATPLVEFDARPFAAISIDYGQVLLSWTSPSGDWDLLRLTRDAGGYSPRADLGDVLLETSVTGAPTSFIDTAPLTEGHFYYYTVWIRSTFDGLWRRAADSTVLVVKNWRYSERLYELMPTVYRDKDGDTVGAKIYGQGPLERFLQIFGFQCNHLRSEYESLKQVANPDRVAGGLLPLVTRQVGFGFEQELGMRLARQQARNAIHLYKLKGTRLGVEGFASVMTGWAPTVSTGINLILDQNEASFAEGLGRWGVEVGSADLTRIDGTVAGLGQAVPTPTGASTGDVGSGPYVMQIDPTVAGDVQVALTPSAGATDAGWRQGLIPVNPSTAYTFSFYVRSNMGRSVRLGLQGFNAVGSNEVATEATAVASITTDWTRLSYTVTTGANTRFMRLFVRFLATATTDLHYLAAGQLEAAGAATTFQDARQTRIQFAPERINHIPNPSAEVDITGWTVESGTTVARSTTVSLFGAASFALDGPAGLRVMRTNRLPVVAGQTYTGSSHWRSATTAGTGVQTLLRWYTAGGVLISTTTGAALIPTTTGWVRPFVTGLAPATAATVEVVVSLAGAGSTTLHHVDAVMLEENAALRDYFDGQSTSNEAEYLWEGTPGNSRTLYYSRRLIKNYRMNARIRDFLPAGSTYKLLYSAS